MKKSFKTLLFLTFCCLCAVWQGCTISYSFSGASIPVEAKTYSVAFFRNNATLVEPTLSQTLTDALKNKMTNQTRLAQVDRNGDLAFEGAITNYVPSQPGAISGETAIMNRMTITVSVKFTNTIEPAQSFEKSFTQYTEYDSQIDLMSIKDASISTVVELLVEDIFNQAVVNW
ncbi:MAG: LPS assembly lipoprotein LptE [Bacteroidales bacterium]|nr:LPS assembly lipoprotein LptE [Bacteroidales bacterium]